VKDSGALVWARTWDSGSEWCHEWWHHETKSAWVFFNHDIDHPVDHEWKGCNTIFYDMPQSVLKQSQVYSPRYSSGIWKYVTVNWRKTGSDLIDSLA
jgi:hypothetical protein